MNPKIKTKRTGVTGIDSVLKFAAKGDLPALKKALAEKPNLLNAMSEGHHRTFLWEAANGNRMEVIKYIVGKGADVNIPGRNRSETFVLLTPYCIAEKRKRKKIAEFLVTHGTELDIYSAAFLGNLGLLKKLVSRNAALVNASHPEDSIWDVVPLHYAIAGEQMKAAQFLISKETKVSKHSERDYSLSVSKKGAIGRL